jgi:hypothetical protein
MSEVALEIRDVVLFPLNVGNRYARKGDEWSRWCSGCWLIHPQKFLYYFKRELPPNIFIHMLRYTYDKLSQ